jgi:hypothetical protein
MGKKMVKNLILQIIINKISISLMILGTMTLPFIGLYIIKKINIPYEILRDTTSVLIFLIAIGFAISISVFIDKTHNKDKERLEEINSYFTLKRNKNLLDSALLFIIKFINIIYIFILFIFVAIILLIGTSGI